IDVSLSIEIKNKEKKISINPSDEKPLNTKEYSIFGVKNNNNKAISITIVEGNNSINNNHTVKINTTITYLISVGSEIIILSNRISNKKIIIIVNIHFFKSFFKKHPICIMISTQLSQFKLIKTIA